jgi:hypothetical protein
MAQLVADHARPDAHTQERLSRQDPPARIVSRQKLCYRALLEPQKRVVNIPVGFLGHRWFLQGNPVAPGLPPRHQA